ncbi:MAG: glycosyltransferase [Actinomycetota bacterium]|nr:glycosyltransferase [Actinomycetota bacterium]
MSGVEGGVAGGVGGGSGVDRAAVVAVVAVHDPGPGLVDLVSDVVAQVGRVVLVDDGSRTGLEVVEGLRDRVTLVRQANAGVAAALNAGIAMALTDQADAVLTLDQDSRVPPGYVAAAVATWQEAGRRGIPVSAVAPASYSGHPAPTAGRLHGHAVAFDPMQSGLLVPTATFRAIGLLDEGFVIDGVDSELTARCLASGLVPVIAPGCELGHGQGDRLPVTLGGRRVTLRGQPLSYNQHSPDRVYYMARNGTVLTRRYARSEPRWVARRLAEEARAHLLRLTFSPDRGQLVRAALEGVRDGVRGRYGARP